MSMKKIMAINNTTSTSLDSGNHKEFLYWLRKRLQHFYKEKDEQVLKSLDKIIYNTKIVPDTIPISTIDSICSRYWKEFQENDEDILEDIFGEEFNSTQKEKIRFFVIGMIADIFKISN